MEQERLDESTDIRFRHLQHMSSTMIENQRDTMQFLADNTGQMAQLVKRAGQIETRMDGREMPMERLEHQIANLTELVTQALDDLAFIKDVLKPGG